MSSSIKKNIIYNMLRVLSSIVFPLITFPYVARVLQPESIGKINFSISFVSYFMLLATLGISVYAIRECSKYRDNKEKYQQTVNEIFSINIITMLLSYTILFAIIYCFNELRNYELIILISSISIFFTVIGTDWINTTMEDFKYITVRTVFFQLVSLILMFTFVRDPSDYIVYAIILVFSTSGAFLTNVLYCRKYVHIHFILQMNFRKHLFPILSLFILQVSIIIMSNVDITMLGLLKSDYDVGLYSVSLKVIMIVVQVVSSVTWVIYPKLSKFFAEKNYKEINSILHKALVITITLGLPCSVGISFLSKDILYVVGGPNYVEAYLCLVILAIAMLFDLSLGNLWGNCVLLASKREKIFIFACIVGMLSNIIGNYILIPIYGIYGAATSTGLSRAIIGVIVIFKQDKNINFGINFNLFLGPIVGSVIIACVIFLFKNISMSFIYSIICTISCSCILYIVVLFFFKNELLLDYFFSLKNKILVKYTRTKIDN